MEANANLLQDVSGAGEPDGAASTDELSAGGDECLASAAGAAVVHRRSIACVSRGSLARFEAADRLSAEHPLRHRQMFRVLLSFLFVCFVPFGFSFNARFAKSIMLLLLGVLFSLLNYYITPLFSY